MCGSGKLKYVAFRKPICPPPRQRFRLGFLNMGWKERLFGVNFGSERHFDSGVRSLTGVNVLAFAEGCLVHCRRGVNLSIAIPLAYVETSAEGINLSLMDATGFLRGTNLSLRINAGIEQSGINLALFQTSGNTQNGITIGMVNEAELQRGITLGLMNAGASKGINVSIVDFGHDYTSSFFSRLPPPTEPPPGVEVEDDVHHGINVAGLSLNDCQRGINLGGIVCSDVEQSGLNAGALNFSEEQAGVSIWGVNVAKRSFRGVSLSLISVMEDAAGICASIVGKYGLFFKGIMLSAVSITTDVTGIGASIVGRHALDFGGVMLSVVSVAQRISGFAASAALFVNELKGVAFSLFSVFRNVTGLSVSATISKADMLDKGVLVAPVTILDKPQYSTGVRLGLLHVNPYETKFFNKYRLFFQSHKWL